jgi:hypothetical protein
MDLVLERTQCDAFWLPADARMVAREEVAYLCCPRDVSHLNVGLRLGAPADEIPRWVAEVAAAHAGVGSEWNLGAPSASPAAERALAAAGYVPVHRHDACAIEVGAYRAQASSGIVVHRIATLDDLDAAIAVSNAGFGLSRSPSEAERHEDLRGCTGTRVYRFLARDAATGEAVASAGMNAHPDLGFGFLWGGSTIPSARGRGAYSALVAARVEVARRLGLSAVGLYARVDTSAPIVVRQGFRRYGVMIRWRRG